MKSLEGLDGLIVREPATIPTFAERAYEIDAGFQRARFHLCRINPRRQGGDLRVNEIEA